MCSKQPTGVSVSEEGKLRGQARAFTDIIVGRIVLQAKAQDVAHVLSGEGTGLLDLNPLSTFKLTETMASLYYPVTLCWLVKAKVRVDGIDGTQIRLQAGGSNIAFLRREPNIREQGGLRCWQRLKSVRAGFVLHQGAEVDESRPFGIVRLLGTQTTGVEKQFLDRLEPWAKRIKTLKDRKGDTFLENIGA